MFTILPSLYLFGVQYFRQWNAPYYNEQTDNEINEKYESISKRSDDLCQKVKTRRKKSNRHRRRRKTSISELSHEDMGYLINETGFTGEEILVWYEDFLRDCPDGKLSKSKFSDIYQQFYQNGQVTKFCEHAFRLFNKDGSGYMDFIEFLLAVSLTSSKDPGRKMELFFSMYDIDQNGLIDENELRSVLESIYDLLGIDISDPSRIDAKVHKIFFNAKCDHLGYLTKDQFANACENDRHIRKLLIPNTKSSINQEN